MRRAEVRKDGLLLEEVAYFRSALIGAAILLRSDAEVKVQPSCSSQHYNNFFKNLI